MKNLNLFDNILRETNTHHYEINSLNEALTKRKYGSKYRLSSLVKTLSDVMEKLTGLQLTEGPQVFKNNRKFFTVELHFEDDVVNGILEDDFYNVSKTRTTREFLTPFEVASCLEYEILDTGINNQMFRDISLRTVNSSGDGKTLYFTFNFNTDKIDILDDIGVQKR